VGINEYEQRFRERFVHRYDGICSGWTVPEQEALVPGRYAGAEWRSYMDATTRMWELRDDWTKRYAWAVPSEEALDAVAALSPLVEVGCGNGYWASLLRARGARVDCFDTATIYKPGTHGRLTHPYVPIAVGDEFRATQMYPDSTLLLCWPPYDSPMAANALRSTRAEFVVFVGEVYGCTASDEAMQLLGHGSSGWYDDDDEQRPSEPTPLFHEFREIEIPRWRGMHDYVGLYRRGREALVQEESNGRMSAMKVRSAVAAALGALAVLAPGAVASTPSHFGRMFPRLPGLTSPTSQQLADLAQTMLDDNTDDGLNNLAVPSGFTYFGQFIDHDLTLDTSPSPTSFVDPTKLTNGRTFRFDLDSLYGGGPDVSPQLYEADGEHLRVQDPSPNDVRDLPRNPDGSAVLVEGRNDENELIAQVHTMMIMAHNRLVDEGDTFREAQRTLQLNYQWAVVHDYLPNIVGQDVVDSILRRNGDVRTRFYKPSSDHPMTPVEFSVAAFRFGHSEVRKQYELNEDSGKIDVFSFTDPDLRGGRPLPAGRQAEWSNFFSELVDPADADGINHSRLIDTKISSSLFQLPIPGAEAQGSNVLAYRNMIRAKFYRMPSGQDVAKTMGIKPITPAQLNLGRAFRHGTPLWYYILAEAQRRENGLVLGPVGARIDAEVFLRLLDLDQRSYLHVRHFTPDPEIAGEDGVLTLSDLFVFAGVADLPDASAPDVTTQGQPAALTTLTAPVVSTPAPAAVEPPAPTPATTPTPEPSPPVTTTPTETTPTETIPAPPPPPVDPPLTDLVKQQVLSTLQANGGWMSTAAIRDAVGVPPRLALQALLADGRVERDVRSDDVYWRAT
jgi:hypothetical protein